MGDAALWATIDLSADSGVEAVRSSRLLRAAARLASGALRCLDVSHSPSYSSFWNAVLAVCAENKASLVSLQYHSAAPLLDDRDVLALRAAAPRATIYCDVEATASAMLPLLREANSLLRVREARIEVLQPGADAAGLAQALSQHAPLTRLVLERDDGMIAGVEIKASATVGRGDFAGLRTLAEACGPRFAQGVVLYDGTGLVPFGDRLAAAPLSALWC